MTADEQQQQQQQQQQPIQRKQQPPPQVIRKMICGGLAGMIAKTATNPLERIKLLSQTNHAQTSNILLLFRRIVAQEGWKGLWAGNGVNLIRVAPAKAVVFSSQDVYKRSYHLPDWAAGGAAGATATIVTYPLDLIRGRISGQLSGAYTGLVQSLLLTVRDEGVRALYKGVTPTLLGAVPYEGIKFGTVGVLEWLLMTMTMTDKNQTTDSATTTTTVSTPVRKMMFGAAGGVMAGLITYPNDTVRRLLQLQGSRGGGGREQQSAMMYTGYVDCVRKTHAAHGITRFYQGLTINLIRMAPNTALQFYFYSLLKNWIEKV